MSGLPERVVLLGPQRPEPDVGRVAHDLGLSGPAALITAGWREWEEDDGHLRAALPGAFNLRLYGRAERVSREDPELTQAHRRLQARIKELRRAYNVRLAPAMDAWIELEGMEGAPEVLDAERRHALRAVRALDRHHARRIGALRREFYARWDPLNRRAVARERDEIRRALEPALVVVVEGGHVLALLNRLRLFGMGDLLAGRVVFACSGGAMALSRRIVLFHDSPPWGPGHAEMGEVGLSLYAGIVAFPDGSRRLRLGDPGRVARLARRFAPDACVVLDRGTRIEWDGRRWRTPGSIRLTDAGRTDTWRGAA